MSRRIQFTGASGSADSTRADALMQDSLPFTSICPRCRGSQLQHGLSTATLQRLLGDGQPVEAYCVMCDWFWQISPRERVAVAKTLAANEHVPEHADVPVQFTSKCPKCLVEQPQQGYSRVVLSSLLARNHAIEAYCVECDEYWDVSPRERSGLVGTLG